MCFLCFGQIYMELYKRIGCFAGKSRIFVHPQYSIL